MERYHSRKTDSALVVCLAPSMVVFERWLGLTYQSLKSRPRFGKAGPDHALMLILFLGVLSSLLAVRVLLLLLVTLLRVVLEICLVLFRIAMHLSDMAGHTEEIAGGLPRITFWKSWWRREPPKG